MNSDKPLISICIPVYNSAEYLDKCLGTLTSQTYSNIEIIAVIDGDMKDDSVEICEKWAAGNPRIRVIKQPHGGLSVARNTGIDNTRGELIGFVDPDDYVEADMYERLYEGLVSEEDIDMCIEGFIGQEEGTESGIELECNDRVINPYEGVGLMINAKISDYPWNKLYRKTLFDDIRYQAGNNFYDVGTTYKLVERSRKIRLIPYAGYHYIHRKGSLTSGRRIPDFLDSVEMHIDRYYYLITKRPDLRKGLCKGLFRSSVSLGAACLVSGRDSRIENKDRRVKDYNIVEQIINENNKLYSGLEKMILRISRSDLTLVLVISMCLEKLRRLIHGK